MFWAAAVGGIASVVGELLLQEKLATIEARPANATTRPSP
jgi:hypothetical protein